MFDMNKLADMAKLANEARSLQQKQEQFQNEQLKLLRTISAQLEELLKIARR